MYARLSAFVIWSIVAATAVFWALRLGASGSTMPPYAVAVERSAPLRGDLARLFGAPPIVVASAETPAEAPSRYRLVGVMAPKGAQQGEGRYGLALIAVDGKPAKAYPVGARIDGDMVIQAVSLRTASVGPAGGGNSTLLELPALPPPATGTLPPPGASFTPPPGGSFTPPPIPGAQLPTPFVPKPLPPAIQAVPPPAAPGMPPSMAAPGVQPAPAGAAAPVNPNAPSADNFRTQ